MKYSTYDNGGFIGRVADYTATDSYQVGVSSPYSFSFDNITFGINSQLTRATGLFFKPDGTLLFVVGRDTDKVFSYSLTTAWDLSTASYTGDSFSVSSAGATPSDIYIKPDGTELYISGELTNGLTQYSLSTAWDITTASFSSDTGILSEASGVMGLTFKPDGTQFYATNWRDKHVHAYSMTTAWDISTHSFSGDEFSLNSQVGAPTDIAFNSDGTIMYAVGESSYFASWDLSTAYDVTTATFNSKFSVAYKTRGIQFNSDYSKLYFVEFNNDTVRQYSASSSTTTGNKKNTGVWSMKKSVHDNGGFIGRVADYAATDYYQISGVYDLANASYDSVSLSLGGAREGVYFKPDGTAFFATDLSGTIDKYSMTTPWDLSTASFTSSSLSASGATGIYFKPDGTRLYYIDNGIDKILQVDLSTAWDLSTAGTAVQGAPAVGTVVKGIRLSSDGTRIYSSDRTNTQIEQFNLSTAWDISSSSANSTPSQTFNAGSQATKPAIYAFNPNGTKMWVTCVGNERIYEYTLSTAWSVSSASYSSISFDLSSQDAKPIGGQFKSDGTKMYIVGKDTDTIYQYSTAVTGNGNKKNTGVWSMDADYLNAL